MKDSVLLILERVDVLLEEAALHDSYARLQRNKVKEFVTESVASADPHDQQELVNFLYWNYPGIAVTDIISPIAPHVNSLLLKGYIDQAVEFECCRCSCRIACRSRAEVARLTAESSKRSNILCETCRHQNLETIFQADRAQRLQRLDEIAEMTLDEFTATAEWRRKRDGALFSADFRCQICNRLDDVLMIWNRKKTSFCWQRESDLLVTCSGCSSRLMSGSPTPQLMDTFNAAEDRAC